MSLRSAEPKQGVRRWLSSFLVPGRGTTAEQQPLLPVYSPRDTDGYILARNNITTVVWTAYINVYGHKFVQREQLSVDEEFRLCREEIDKACSKILIIYRSKPAHFWLVGWIEIFDYAMMVVMGAIAATSVKYNVYIRSFNDITGAYVMEELIFPLKTQHMHMVGESLIHRTVLEIEYTFGPNILAAIASRNDQRFRGAELLDKEIISKFKKRYGDDKLKAFIAS